MTNHTNTLENRLRTIRKGRGLTLKQAAHHVGITYQQMQKYETGANRISAPRMAALAELYGCHPGEFFGGTAGNSDKTFEARSPDEVRLLTAYRSARHDQRAAILTLMAATETPAAIAAE